MKSVFNLVFVLSSIFAASAAFASSEWQLVCNNSAGDGGHVVTFSADGLSARVEQNSIAGLNVVATLSCEKVGPAPCCDIPVVTHCTDEKTGTGYSLKLTSGGFTGAQIVELRQGSESLGRILCRSERVKE